MAAKKTQRASRPQSSKSGKAAGKKTASASARSMPEAGRDPQGGLTAAGRAFFAKTEGAHLRPGVKGTADTPEKMVRKGSFLRRHFAHPRGPMVDSKGQPTRLALSAHAWGEPVPRTMADARKLAAKGHALLEQYHKVQDGEAPGKGGQQARTTPAKKASTKKASTKKAAAKKAAAKKAAAKKAGTKRANTKKAALEKIGSNRKTAGSR